MALQKASRFYLFKDGGEDGTGCPAQVVQKEWPHFMPGQDCWYHADGESIGVTEPPPADGSEFFSHKLSDLFLNAHKSARNDCEEARALFQKIVTSTEKLKAEFSDLCYNIRRMESIDAVQAEAQAAKDAMSEIVKKLEKKHGSIIGQLTIEQSPQDPFAEITKNPYAFGGRPVGRGDRSWQYCNFVNQDLVKATTFCDRFITTVSTGVDTVINRLELGTEHVSSYSEAVASVIRDYKCSLGARQDITVTKDVLQRLPFYQPKALRLSGGAPAAPSSSFSLTICSSNIQNFGFLNRDNATVTQISKTLADTGSDFIVLQEIQKSLVDGQYTHSGGKYSPDASMKLFHQQMCGGGYILSQSVDATSTTKDAEGLPRKPGLGSEFSALYFNPLKFTVLGQGFIDSSIIAQSSDALNGHHYMPYAWLCRPLDDLSTEPFVIVDVHLAPNEQKLQTMELLHIVERMKRLAHPRYLIVGDCNFKDRDAIQECFRQVKDDSKVELSTLNKKYEGTNAARTKPYDHVLTPGSFSPTNTPTWATIDFVDAKIRAAWETASKAARAHKRSKTSGDSADDLMAKITKFSDHCPVKCTAAFPRN